MRSSLLRTVLLALLVLPATLLTGCPDPDEDGDGVSVGSGDCDDDNPGIFPGSIEIVCDGVDQDCDGFDRDDVDGDGVSGCPGADPFDCDDQDASAYPGNTEVCNGADDDCDGVADNGLPEFDWWVDGDEDGFGAGSVTTTCADDAPDEPQGVVYVSADLPAEEDCDDELDSVFPGATEVCDGEDQDCDGVADNGLGDNTYWPDVDGDLAGDEDNAITTCSATAPADHVDAGATGTGDCDDNDADNYPGNTEVCDGADNDCDGLIDNGFDLDNDTTFDGADAGCLATYGAADVDCDDTDPLNFPGNPEVCDNQDNNCDGVIDENNDGDNDGFTVCGVPADCFEGNAAIYPGATEICDGLDGDCDTVVPADETDDDTDNYIECTVPTGVSLPGVLLGGDDCDDGNALINTGMAEVCSGADDDCDGVLFIGVGGETELDADSDFYLECPGAGALFVDIGIGMLGGDDCDDSAATGAGVNPGVAEICDGLDQNCDTIADDGFDVDADGFFDGADAGCVATYPSVDCLDSDFDVNPDADEICDLVDNDCDTLIDAADPSFAGSDFDGDGDPAIACGGNDCDDDDNTTQGLDAEADGESICDGDCDDTSPLFNTSHAEFCDGEDNDCDGTVDNNLVSDADGDGFTSADCGLGGTDCDDGDAHVFPDTTYTSGWQRECEPAVKPGFFGSWAHGRLNLPSFFEDPQTGNEYLYFRGHHNQTFNQIGYVTRAAGADLWGDIEGPVFSENSVAGTWDGRKISHASVAYVPGKVQGYVMAYHAQHDSNSGRAVGIATANLATGQDTDADGIADAPFQRDDLAGVAVATEVIAVSASATAGDNERVINPSLWYDTNSQLLHMWYTGRYGNPNDFVIVHASCDTQTTDCGPGDWIKTDTNSDGDPDIYLSGTTGAWDDLNTQQTFVMEHTDSAGFFGYELEVWYTGGGTAIGYLQGDIADATTWATYASNPVLSPTTAADRFDSGSVTGRGVYWDDTDLADLKYHMYYGTSVDLPPGGGLEGTDVLWGVGNFSNGASYIGHATNSPPLFTQSITCSSAAGDVTDHAPDTVELEVYDGSTMIAGPVFGNATGNTNTTIQTTTFAVAMTLGAGAHDITVVGTDAGGVQRSVTASLTCP